MNKTVNVYVGSPLGEMWRLKNRSHSTTLNENNREYNCCLRMMTTCKLINKGSKKLLH